MALSFSFFCREQSFVSFSFFHLCKRSAYGLLQVQYHCLQAFDSRVKVHHGAYLFQGSFCREAYAVAATDHHIILRLGGAIREAVEVYPYANISRMLATPALGKRAVYSRGIYSMFSSKNRLIHWQHGERAVRTCGSVKSPRWNSQARQARTFANT